MNIEKSIFPDAWKLKWNGEYFESMIIDCEIDPFECSFIGDGSIEINTNGYAAIQLDVDGLKKIIKMIKEADKKYNEMD